MSLKTPHSTCQMPGLLFQRLNQFKCQIQTDWRSPSGIPRWDFSRKKIKDISTVRGFQVISYTHVFIQRSNASTFRWRRCFSRSLCLSSPCTSAPPRCTFAYFLSPVSATAYKQITPLPKSLALTFLSPWAKPHILTSTEPNSPLLSQMNMKGIRDKARNGWNSVFWLGYSTESVKGPEDRGTTAVARFS